MKQQACTNPGPLENIDSTDDSFSDAMWRGLGWLSLLALIVGNFYHMATITHFGAGTGLLTLLLSVREWWGQLLQERWGKWPVLVFFGSAILNTFYPAWPDVEMVAGSLHALWTSLEAFIGVLLCLYLLRTKQDFSMLYQLLLLAVFVFLLWAPLDFWMRGGFQLNARMTGAKGSAFNHSMVLYMLSYLAWGLAFARVLMQEKRPEWVWRFGYLAPLLILLPILTLERPLYTNIPWAQGWVGYLPYVALCLGGCVWWWAMGVARLRMPVLLMTLLLLGLNIACTATRSAMLLFLLAGGLLLVMGKMYSRRALVIFLLIGVAAVGILATQPRFRSATSMRHRLYIWEGSLGVIRDSFPFGIGYGKKSFSDAWTAHRPDPTNYGLLECSDIDPQDLQNVSHAHNLWLQLLAERGIIGFVTFHWLWIAVGLYLLRVAYPKTKEEGEPQALAPYRIIVKASLVAVVLLSLEGMIEFPLYRSNERLMWFIAGLGVVAAARLRAYGETPALADTIERE